jgi:Beta-lactamase enzyme family
VRTPEGVVELMVAQPRLASVAAWTVGDLDGGLFHDADLVRPVAAVTKVLIASALARALAAGERQPGKALSVDRVEHFHFKDADLGAHRTAMARLGVTTTASLDQLAQAMLRWGDPAAADALLLELGRPALEAEVQRLGIEGLFAPAPYAGDLVRLIEDGKAGDAVDLDRSWAIGKRLLADDAYGRRLRLRIEASGMPRYSALRAHRKASSHRGSARAYALLMERIATEQSKWGETMRRWLSWPMGMAFVNARWDAYGTKSGSAVSILSTTFAQPIDGGLAVSAMFFEDVPTLAWLTLDDEYPYQDVEQALLADPEFRAVFARRLRGDGGQP